jgi:spore maturation protein CgeB
MFSVYTDDIASMFEEDKEVVFFKSKEELLSKVKYYLKNDKEREKICQNAYERVIRDGHSATARVSQIIDDYRRLTN